MPQAVARGMVGAARAGLSTLMFLTLPSSLFPLISYININIQTSRHQHIQTSAHPDSKTSTHPNIQIKTSHQDTMQYTLLFTSALAALVLAAPLGPPVAPVSSHSSLRHRPDQANRHRSKPISIATSNTKNQKVPRSSATSQADCIQTAPTSALPPSQHHSGLQ